MSKIFPLAEILLKSFSRLIPSLGNYVRPRDTREIVDGQQCDQIRRLLKVLGDIFCYLAQIFGQVWARYFENNTI